MSSPDGGIFDLLGILAVLVLVIANGFFVASEFSLVAIRRSRVAELVAAGRMNAAVLQRATENLDAHLAATQLGITISSLALGWIGEPALAHLIEPFLIALPGSLAAPTSHAIAVAIAFITITALHIVLGELAPKSLALQRTEGTALWVVRPLGFFLFLLRPAIIALNGLGNLVLKLAGLRPGAAAESLHSPEELKLLVQASQEAGILHHAQQEVVVRVLNIGERPIGDIMTPRPEVEWIDTNDDRDESLRIIRECRHQQLLVGSGGIDEPLGMVSKKDLLDQVLDGKELDPMAVIREPLVVLESTPTFKVLERFKQSPVRLAIIVDEYGSMQGIVTQTDLLEAIAGDLPDVEGEEPSIIERKDGSLLIDGMMPAHDAFERLSMKTPPEDGDFHTIAGFALFQLGHLPVPGETFAYEGWRFEIVDMDGLRIDKLLAQREPAGDAVSG
ncbi:MAG: hemolysin family protein [Beijerinckiaceae bacterium]|nr:hemolysin family protein [Beijerinckiaceae bacterium]